MAASYPRPIYVRIGDTLIDSAKGIWRLNGHDVPFVRDVDIHIPLRGTITFSVDFLASDGESVQTTKWGASAECAQADSGTE